LIKVFGERYLLEHIKLSLVKSLVILVYVKVQIFYAAG